MDYPEGASQHDSPQEMMYPDIDETMQYPWPPSQPEHGLSQIPVDPAIDPRLYSDPFAGNIADGLQQDSLSDYRSSPRKPRRQSETFEDGDYSSEDPTYDVSEEDESST